MRRPACAAATGLGSWPLRQPVWTAEPAPDRPPPSVATRPDSACHWRRHGPQVRQERGQADQSIARSASSRPPASLPARGLQPRTLRDPSMKRPGDPLHCHGPTEPHTQKPRPSRHRPFRLPRAWVRDSSVERPGMCSVPAMRPAQNRAIPDTPRPKALLSRTISALTARARRIPIPLRMGSATTAPDDDSPAFALVRAYVEPPAGIEPATPSLPWMCSAD
jgi:hypothetical protein